MKRNTRKRRHVCRPVLVLDGIGICAACRKAVRARLAPVVIRRRAA